VRTNLDPFSVYDDARLWASLHRSFLVENQPSSTENLMVEHDGSGNNPSRSRINLETIIEPEGANLSVGERSLLSLARALVKDTRVVILDEAT
jgi:ATP-binding cassette subfamily C (CFTR/MRP) protein 1